MYIGHAIANIRMLYQYVFSYAYRIIDEWNSVSDSYLSYILHEVKYS